MPIPQAPRDRAKACLEALDAWELAEAAREAEVKRWEAKLERVQDLQAEISEQIAELPANTMQGLNAKLPIVNAEPLWAQETGIAESALEDMRRIDTAAPHFN